MATYLAVGLAVLAFFNRDRLSEMLGWQGPQVVAATLTPPIQTPPAQVPASTPLQAPTPPAASAPAQTAPKDRLEPQLAAAGNAYWQGDVEAAIERYRDLLAQYPDSETLHVELGNIY